MKIFISWSGKRSKKVAQFVSTWIKQVLQTSEPWISSEIEKGRSWSEEISKNLNESNMAIICLTQENLNSNWIHFEAGAIIKGTKGNACTFLLDVSPADVEPPLSLFQATRFNKEDVKNLILDLNLKLEKSLDIQTISEVFEMFWPKFQLEITKILEEQTKEEVIERSSENMIEEILLNSRQLDKNLNKTLDWVITKLEKNFPSNTTSMNHQRIRALTLDEFFKTLPPKWNQNNYSSSKYNFLNVQDEQE